MNAFVYNAHVTYGLCRGRHEMPVCGYVFDGIENVLDFEAIKNVAIDFVESHCNLRHTWGCGINQVDYTDVELVCGDELHIAVTGLTACTSAIMYACASNGVPLVLWHYDRASGEYAPQYFDF